MNGHRFNVGEVESRESRRYRIRDLSMGTALLFRWPTPLPFSPQLTPRFPSLNTRLRIWGERRLGRSIFGNQGSSSSNFLHCSICIRGRSQPGRKSEVSEPTPNTISVTNDSLPTGNTTVQCRLQRPRRPLQDLILLQPTSDHQPARRNPRKPGEGCHNPLPFSRSHGPVTDASHGSKSATGLSLAVLAPRKA